MHAKHPACKNHECFWHMCCNALRLVTFAFGTCAFKVLYNALFGRVTWLQCCMFDNFKRCRACPHEPYDAVAWVTLSCAVVCRLYDIPSAVELPKAPCVVCNMNARTLLRSRRFQDENNHAQPSKFYMKFHNAWSMHAWLHVMIHDIRRAILNACPLS